MSLTFASNLTKMIDAGLGGEMVAPDTSVAVGYRMQYNLVSGPVASWNDPEGGLPINLIAAIEPIQDLHGQANPYPAGGGKNLFDKSATNTENGYGAAQYIGITGEPTVSANYNISEYISVSAETVYTLNPTSGSNPSVVFYDSNKQYISGVDYSSVTAFTFTTPANAAYLRASIPIANVDIFQLELGSTATAYAPYSNICPISGRSVVRIWHDATHDTSADPTLTIQLGDVVYGGSLNVTTGVMTVEWANIASYDGETLPGEWISDHDVYSPGATPTTGAQVCYKLAEPLTVQLSPQTINSLLGQNNVWSDAGDVSVTWKEKLYTEGY